MQTEVLEATAASGVRLRVEFGWRGDRFGHVISLVDAKGSTMELLESIEGGASDAWPPSPPLQSLNLHMLPDGRRAALLVGMAGRSHWSASIETAADRPVIIFDIACRTSGDAGVLQSRYRLADNEPTINIQEPGTIEVVYGAHQLRISVDHAADLSLQGRAFSVTANDPRRSPTRRWKYQIEYELPGDFDHA